MKFVMSVSVFGDKMYDIEAKSEEEAKIKVKEVAVKDFNCDGRYLSFGYSKLLCPKCKNEMHSSYVFCPRCGRPRNGEVSQ